MIIGIGIDIVRNERIEGAIKRWGDRFLNKIFTEAEKEYASRHKSSAQHLSARLAVKEATFKALGTGWDEGMGWKDIEVLNNPQGRPQLTVKGKVKRLFEAKGVKTIHTSISHEKDYSIAQVILTDD